MFYKAPERQRELNCTSQLHFHLKTIYLFSQCKFTECLYFDGYCWKFHLLGDFYLSLTKSCKIVLSHFIDEKAESQISQVELSGMEKNMLLAVSVLSAILIYASLFVCHTCCLLYDVQWFKVIGKPCKCFLVFHSLLLMHGTLSLKRTCHNIIQKGKQRPHTEGQAPSSQAQVFFFFWQKSLFIFLAKDRLWPFIIISMLFSFLPPYSSHSLLCA